MTAAIRPISIIKKPARKFGAGGSGQGKIGTDIMGASIVIDVSERKPNHD